MLLQCLGCLGPARKDFHRGVFVCHPVSVAAAGDENKQAREAPSGISVVESVFMPPVSLRGCFFSMQAAEWMQVWGLNKSRHRF